jgi:hypothetical protein
MTLKAATYLALIKVIYHIIVQFFLQFSMCALFWILFAHQHRSEQFVRPLTAHSKLYHCTVTTKSCKEEI